MKMKWLNNRNAIITISIALFLIVWTILGVIKNQKIKKHGLFAIATISETSQGKSGTNVKAIFYYKTNHIKYLFCQVLLIVQSEDSSLLNFYQIIL